MRRGCTTEEKFFGWFSEQLFDFCKGISKNDWTKAAARGDRPIQYRPIRYTFRHGEIHAFVYNRISLRNLETKMLAFDICPPLAHVSERKLFLPSGTSIPENLERLAIEFVTDKRIVKAWDEMLRLVASIRTGRVSVSWALDRLGTFGREEPVQRGFDDLGRFLRSEFLCDYFANPEFRRELRTLLNRGESVHQLQRVIYYGRVQPERGRRRDELRAISGLARAADQHRDRLEHDEDPGGGRAAAQERPGGRRDAAAAHRTGAISQHQLPWPVELRNRPVRRRSVAETEQQGLGDGPRLAIGTATWPRKRAAPRLASILGGHDLRAYPACLILRSSTKSST